MSNIRSIPTMTQSTSSMAAPIISRDIDAKLHELEAQILSRRNDISLLLKNSIFTRDPNEERSCEVVNLSITQYCETLKAQAQPLVEAGQQLIQARQQIISDSIKQNLLDHTSIAADLCRIITSDYHAMPDTNPMSESFSEMLDKQLKMIDDSERDHYCQAFTRRGGGP